MKISVYTDTPHGDMRHVKKEAGLFRRSYYLLKARVGRGGWVCLPAAHFAWESGDERKLMAYRLSSHAREFPDWVPAFRADFPIRLGWATFSLWTDERPTADKWQSDQAAHQRHEWPHRAGGSAQAADIGE